MPGLKMSSRPPGGTTVILSIPRNVILTKKSKICALKMLLGPAYAALVLSTKTSSNNPMLVSFQGKSSLESEVSSCGGP